LFDRLSSAEYDLGKTAALCGVSASQLERAMRKHPQLWRTFSESRQKESGGLPD
jgi:hypothetical protein